jgi:2-hydroxychromene-2-carboxylate isomerase
VVDRGIEDDPAVADKRRYAVDDARRIGARSGLVLSRSEPLAAGTTAFLAAWVAGAQPTPALQAFCVEAARALWFGPGGAVEPARFEELWGEHVGGVPVADQGAVSRNEARMRRRGPYDTPAAAIGGQWYFAHDRLEQIADRLDRLGWRAGR